MAIKIKLKGNAGRQNSPDWYRKDTEELAGVTNLPSNKEIGLDNVIIFDPSEAQAGTGIICPIMIKTVIGDIRGLVCQSKNAPNTIYVRPPQSREENEETGEIKWHNEVNLNSKITAQVLRYMETQIDILDDTPEEDKDITDMQVGVSSNPFAGETSVPADNVDQQTVPADDGENPFAE